MQVGFDLGVGIDLLRPPALIRTLARYTRPRTKTFNHQHWPVLQKDDEMITRRTVSRTLVTLGCVVLFVAATLHCLAYLKFSAPAVRASNLPIALQSVFEVAFLSMAWSWIVLALIVLVATFGEAPLGKPIALICGFAVLIQAVFTVPMVGFFIGNEMIGAASLLIIIGCFLFHGSRVET
jgi:hypothetical protein